MTKAIGVCGLIGAGKGTVSDVLIGEMWFKRFSFADGVKDTVAALFGWSRAMLEGDTEESREFREKPDPFWSREFGFPVTPRWAMVKVGTECGRDQLHPDIWVIRTKRAASEHDRVVFPDVRFGNERSAIWDLGGEIWAVRRAPEPDWFEEAVRQSETSHEAMLEYMRQVNGKLPVEDQVHRSEYEWIAPWDQFDRVFQNDGTIDEFKGEVRAAARAFVG